MEKIEKQINKTWSKDKKTNYSFKDAYNRANQTKYRARYGFVLKKYGH